MQGQPCCGSIHTRSRSRRNQTLLWLLQPEPGRGRCSTAGGSGAGELQRPTQEPATDASLHPQAPGRARLRPRSQPPEETRQKDRRTASFTHSVPITAFRAPRCTARTGTSGWRRGPGVWPRGRPRAPAHGAGDLATWPPALRRLWRAPRLAGCVSHLIMWEP